MQNESSLSAPFLRDVRALFVDGKWSTGSDAPIAVVNPSDGEQLLTLGQASVRELDVAVAAARAAFEHRRWSRISASERARLLFRLADLVERDAEIISELETLSAGMPIGLARHMALPLVVSILRYYAGWVTKIHGETIPASPGAAGGAPVLTYTRREPIGVVAQIIPWNFPLGLAVLKVAPALATGCTVVLKPSELTPLTALYLAQLAAEAGFPEGVLNVVNGQGASVGAALAAHPGVDKISFTGSTQVGRAILAAAAGNLKKVSLELGGKSPVIVFDDADLDLAIPGAAMAAFLLQGQNCMAGTRLFVQRKIHDRFMAGIEAFAKSLKLGPAIAPDTVLGPLISGTQLDRVMSFIDTARAEGAELVTGGNRFGTRGNFIEPTLFANTTPAMRLVREEVFGPVISAQVFADEDLDDLAKRVNDTPYGLSGSVWTTSLSRAHRMAHLVRAGQVSINCHGAVDIGIPFGGYKQSGWGREYGQAALDLYTETKAVIARL